MNTLQKESVKKSLNNLISRLQEIKERHLEVEEGWNEISDNISKVHDIFNKIIDAFILECRIRLDKLNTTSWPFSLIDYFIDHLYLCIFQFRKLYALLFMSPAPNRLYYYLFYREIQYCFRGISIDPHDSSCVMIGTGSMAHWPLDEILIGHTKSFRLLLDTKVRDMLNEACAVKMSGFECDFQEPLDRQMVMVHELFHLICRSNSYIREEFKRITSNPAIRNTIIVGDQPINEVQIEEIFCDISAVRFFGPIYAKSFLEEIVFRQKENTKSHPHRIIRLQLLLYSWPKKTKYHPYLLELSKYINTHEHGSSIPSEHMETLIQEFNRLHKKMGITRYIPVNKINEIKECIENNTSYIYSKNKGDIRELLNNLPDKPDISKEAQKNYNEFLLESVRKNIMWREFNSVKDILKPKLPQIN